MAADPDTDDAMTIAVGPERTVVVVRGDLDAVSAPGLRTALLQIVDDGPPALRLDLSAVEFLDSAGISALVVTHNRCLDAEVPFELSSVPDASRRVLEITRLIDVFTIID
jgi:anti-sigma B factor antagonist